MREQDRIDDKIPLRFSESADVIPRHNYSSAKNRTDATKRKKTKANMLETKFDMSMTFVTLPSVVLGSLSIRLNFIVLSIV